MQTVVIVDDELIPRRIAEKALEEIYTVYSYEDARTAFSELPVTRPDILLVDLHMPDMDGYAILNAVRQLEDSELCGVPVVIMTSDDDSNNEIKGFDLGAYDYIRKPLFPDVLIRRVDCIMKRKEVLKHLEKKAEIDTLTGLLNRSACVRQVDENLNMHRDYGLFLMLDLDHFKVVNDCFGHDIGDKVLVMVSEILKKLVRSDDILGRIGGDEFVIFYRGIWNEEAIKERCEDICKKVKEGIDKLLNAPSSLQLGVSIGIAFAPENGKDFLELYQNADEALYHVKTEGQGGYFIYKEKLEEEHAAAGVITLSNMRSRIEERDFSSGAYMVNFKDFCSIYHFIKRSGERGHIPVQMLMLTVEESDDADRRGLEERMREFGSLLNKTMRKGDVIVRYGNKQYMLLLVGANEEGGKLALNRIINRRTEEENRKYPLQYEFNTLIS